MKSDCRADHEPLGVVHAEPRRARRTRGGSPHLASLEQELRSVLGTRVDLKQKPNGRGQIVIHFSSHEEFDRLRAQLCGRAQGSKVG